MDELGGQIKTLRLHTKERTDSMQNQIKDLVKNGSKLDSWEDKDIKVHLSENRISIYFMFDLSKDKTQKIEIELVAVNKDKLYDYRGEIRPDMVDKNLELGDVYEIRFPSVSINLLKYDRKEEAECIHVCNYIGKEFYKRQGSDGLMALIKGFYDELTVLWNKMDLLSSGHSILHSKRETFELKVKYREAEEMNLLKEGNVIMVFYKRKEFVEFTSYTIKSVRSKYISVDVNYGRVESTAVDTNTSSEPNYEYRFFLKFRYNGFVEKLEKAEFYKTIGNALYTESRVEIYNLDDWNNFEMLYKSERDSLLFKGILAPEYRKISENYQRIKEL